MSILVWTWILTGLSFALYIYIAYASRAKTTGDFYVAEKSVPPFMNGMATGADWMSAASFISMAGLISFLGRDGSFYLMGWTGGYVLLAMLFGPYLRKYGKFTIPQFIGDRYYSNTARLIALVCAIFVSFTYVAGQMRGVGVVFSRFMDVGINTGVIIGMALVFFYATLGGMKGITYTQVAQYVVLITAYLIPAIFISMQFTGNPIPQIGLRLADHRRRRGAAQRPQHPGQVPARRSERPPEGSRFCRLHQWPAADDRRLLHHLLADDRHRRSAAHPDPLLHRTQDA